MVQFVVFFAGWPYFCFTETLTVGFIIDKVESRGTNIAVNFSEWFLEKVLTIF